jgi:hypothetical protein
MLFEPRGARGARGKKVRNVFPVFPVCPSERSERVVECFLNHGGRGKNDNAGVMGVKHDQIWHHVTLLMSFFDIY